MVLNLRTGDATPGLLDNESDEVAPTLGATLELTERGVQLRVPFFPDVRPGSHFAGITEWGDFSDDTSTRNFLLQTQDGPAHLFQNRVFRHTSHSARPSTTLFEPRDTVFPAEAVDMPDTLAVTRLRSDVDGLLAFTRWKSWETKGTHHENGVLVRALDIHVEGTQRVSWSQGDATMTLRTQWDTEVRDRPDGRGGIDIIDRVVLMSEFVDSRPVADHIREQRAFLDLVSIAVFGRSLYFRHHEISDPSYGSTVPAVARDGEDTFTYEPFHHLITMDTRNEATQPHPDAQRLRDDIYLPLGAFPQHVLDGWGAASDRWQQFLRPLRALLRRVPTAPDDFVVTGSIAFERASDLLGRQPGEEATYQTTKDGKTRPTVATDIYRCLHQLGVDWSDLGTDTVGVARTIAWHYNGVKHPRGETAESEHLLLTAFIVRAAVRLFTLWIADPTGGLLGSARAQHRVQHVAEYFHLYGFTLTDNGRFVAL
ncbi:hypothetical protein CQ040_11340 [Microbacterium sp. MYb54]|uniref:hypothetical protein n=1 Tax=unclassified Microbacterium TaxID=2609290 RepID=UPI000CFCD4A7|nr:MULTISPECIES: hypothetical protein [unclassified Microbacterium]PQZ58295.1 hypothetical protein CQ032_07255 [Microbacterium sp. MYb43]PQZ73763.1 hypothetical protein CQ031_16925 [Microbacterium sp. MYb40]PRB20540.1 hypothetical protein CQ040_11340 [Microbacterium sp. MYb54]PRB28375.1 hypothetical protein CQ037_09815 [Microbacterium sp. MYb50]PRB66562.1 hypothetical protein CQ021_10200 [Microbacterium sp. MYb24]